MTDALPFIDVHAHVSPAGFPAAPAGAAGHWPCMRCEADGRSTMLVGDTPFRVLDDRSWDIARRLDDMERNGVSVQVLSPMPELLSYWLATSEAALLCDTTNALIADMIARAPTRFRGLGSIALQDPARSAADLRRLRQVFDLSGVEIGSNIAGTMLGDPALDPFWEAAAGEGMAVFVHALHPIAAKPVAASPLYTAFALFPIDVAMAAASVAMAGVVDRFPGLRLGFSHGGGALGAIIGRLDTGWEKTGGFRGAAHRRPSEVARGFFYDSNVYDPAYLAHLAREVAPGRVFAGTDYPYDIMQVSPRDYLRRAPVDAATLADISCHAASAFLNEDFATGACAGGHA